VSGERLWAPWRLDYIREPGPEECIFCRAASSEGDDERASHVVARGERCFALLNAYPYTSGHLMVTPYDHVPSIEDLDADTVAELMALAQRSLAALRRNYGSEGFNLGINQGKVAGAGLEDHVHLHVVPRWGGDTNFMPVVGDVRVLPQSLDDAWTELRQRFAEASA
jgi:ATP adenylyltransferase